MTASFDQVLYEDETFEWDSMATFSSYGYTMDQRIKPDIVAPGIVTSAATSE